MNDSWGDSCSQGLSSWATHTTGGIPRLVTGEDEHLRNAEVSSPQRASCFQMKARLQCTLTVQEGRNWVSRLHVKTKGASKYTISQALRRGSTSLLSWKHWNSILYGILLASAKCTHKTHKTSLKSSHFTDIIWFVSYFSRKVLYFNRRHYKGHSKASFHTHFWSASESCLCIIAVCLIHAQHVWHFLLQTELIFS